VFRKRAGSKNALSSNNGKVQNKCKEVFHEEKRRYVVEIIRTFRLDSRN